jgi:hypothetical protein
MLAKRCALVATTLRARPAAEKAVIVAAVRSTSGRSSSPVGYARSCTRHTPQGRRRSPSRDGGLDHVGKLLLRV